MAEYRAYAIGHIFKSAPLVCDDDEEAFTRARLEFENCTIEVWSGARFVVRLDALPGGGSPTGPQFVCRIFPAGEKVKAMRTGLPSKLK